MSILTDPIAVPEPDLNTPITIRLTYAELRQVYDLLGKCPYERAAPLVHELARQAEPQLQATLGNRTPAVARLTQ
jgi:hypothetical protein